ncbi:uncharacterized protein CANTADRAFT_23640 [Suhomyces tanzawaensis NRRL Y-17324]|uniref:Swi5-domain-containing protein n=1 Tax=Suhomyces tanzawaensis NRRL Y-17324 TaxID=984487 RepID=A0A1E4SDD3_9ASCO|nr:uncharacterized protein CANTADRAFT_23640 [Suhomyces tanzawaensis NRRL Y-17324]ODV77524.1 hypothetical protein CANTADRAFT_23640 [Suhomyces tanzawaensis NRRL Y-17324]
MFKSMSPTDIPNNTHPPPPSQQPPPEIAAPASTDGSPILPSPTSLTSSSPFPLMESSSSAHAPVVATSTTSNVPTIDNTPRTENLDAVPTEDPNELIRQRIILKEQRLNEIKNQCSALISELDSNKDPEAIVKKHISQLKKYHELKDIALGLVTMIADQRQLRTTDILEEMKFELLDE